MKEFDFHEFPFVAYNNYFKSLSVNLKSVDYQRQNFLPAWGKPITCSKLFSEKDWIIYVRL